MLSPYIEGHVIPKKVLFCVLAHLSLFLSLPTEGGPPVRMLDGRPPWVQERRLRQWLSEGGGRTSGGWEAVSVQCQDGRLNVAVDRHILQVTFTMWLYW